MPPKPLKGTLSQDQKYKTTVEIGQKIAGSACQVGMWDFHEKFQFLQTLYECWQQNVPVTIVP